MAYVGVQASAAEVAASTNLAWNTQNAFTPVLADWGPVGQPIPITSLANGAQALGTPNGNSSNPYAGRTATSQAAIDLIDTLTNEDGAATPIIYASRAVGTTPVAASLVLDDSTPEAALTVTAQYVGAGGNGIYVTVDNTGAAITITLQDSNAYVLAASPSLGSIEAAVNWLATTGYATGTAGAGNLPVTLAATPLSGGTDDRTGLTAAAAQTALAAFSPSLGPGQVLVNGWTNTNLNGIWSALASHASDNNRVALLDLDDNVAALTAISDIGEFGESAAASYAGFWAGNRNIPGVAAGSTRSVAPSAVIAALCARSDASSGNPNNAPAGIGLPLVYGTTPTSIVSGSPLDTYSQADLNALNAAGINTFQNVNGAPTNYGFVSSELISQDQIYWQLTHSRLRMFIIATAQQLGQQFMFRQIDSAGKTQAALKSVLDGQLMSPLASAGALYATTLLPTGYSIDTGSDINTPTSIAQGQLNAVITCSFSYFAQTVRLLVNVQPITNN